MSHYSVPKSSSRFVRRTCMDMSYLLKHTISMLPQIEADYCRPSQRYRVTAASPVCSTEHTCGPTLQTDHIRPSSIFCCGSHCVEQSSCHIQRPDNQRSLLPMAFKDSSVRTTASAPKCLARARFYMITRSINSHSQIQLEHLQHWQNN